MAITQRDPELHDLKAMLQTMIHGLINEASALAAWSDLSFILAIEHFS